MALWKTNTKICFQHEDWWFALWNLRKARSDEKQTGSDQTWRFTPVIFLTGPAKHLSIARKLLLVSESSYSSRKERLVKLPTNGTFPRYSGAASKCSSTAARASCLMTATKQIIRSQPCLVWIRGTVQLTALLLHLVQVYKEPLEQKASEGQPLLAQEDIRSVFGGIPDIARLHASIHKDLSDLIDDWDEGCCIADVINKYQEQLIKV